MPKCRAVVPAATLRRIGEWDTQICPILLHRTRPEPAVGKRRGGASRDLRPLESSTFSKVQNMDAKNLDAKTPAAAPGHGQNTKSAELKVGDKNYKFPIYE